MIILINFYLFLCVAPAWHSSHHTSWLVACLSCGWWSWMDQDIFKNNLHHHFRSTSKITWCLVWNHSWNSQFLSQLKYDHVRDRKFSPVYTYTYTRSHRELESQILVRWWTQLIMSLKKIFVNVHSLQMKKWTYLLLDNPFYLSITAFFL